tara:strand:- start:50070 stop:50966 length:897 start_codon:yes stop_codon:yes gene_type:complete
MIGTALQSFLRRTSGFQPAWLWLSYSGSALFLWPFRLVQVPAPAFLTSPTSSFPGAPYSGRSVFSRVVVLLSLFWLVLLATESVQAREMRTLNVDPTKTRWENTKQYSLEHCSELKQDVMNLFFSRSPLKKWHSFNYKGFHFEFGTGGELQIEHRYRWQVLPHAEGHWEFRDEGLVLKAQYRQFLIHPCMATCMAGSDYYPYRQDMDRAFYARWKLDRPLRNVNSCKMHCFRRILDDYGKTMVDFELQLKITSRVGSGSDAGPVIVIQGLQIEDPEPAPGKQSYNLDLFSEPFEIKCD